MEKIVTACYVIINLIFTIVRSHELQIAWMKLNAFYSGYILLIHNSIGMVEQYN